MSANVPAAGTPRQFITKSSALPRSFKELQQAARLSMKLEGQVKFFNQEGKQIRTDMNVKDVKDGQIIDVVFVKRDPLCAGPSVPVQSTNKEDFMEHKMHEKTETAKPDCMSFMTKDAMRSQFDGQSTYAQDFNNSPVQRKSARRANVQPVYSRHFMHHAAHTPGYSSYAEQFGRPYGRGGSGPAPPADTTSIRTSVLTALSKGHKMDAESSYRSDFCLKGKHKPMQPVIPVISDIDSTLTDVVRAAPFEGESNYQANYLANYLPPTKTFQPVITAPLVREPKFEGGTEYSTTFQNVNGLASKVIFRQEMNS